jgi:hypothetical protein
MRTVRYRNTAGKFYDALVVGPGSSSLEQQTFTATGATAGTVTLSWNGAGPSVAVNFNSTATALRQALEGLDNIEVGELTSSGGPLNTTPIVITWTGLRYGGLNLPLTTKTGSLTTADLVITESQAGGSGHVDLKLTSFLNRTVLTNIAPATALTSTNAYFVSWGPDPVQA